MIAFEPESKTGRSSLWRILCLADCRGFIDLKNLVCANVTQRLHNAARPMDFNARCFCIGSQSKVNPLVAGGEITPARSNNRHLRSHVSLYAHFGTNRVSIALMANQPHG